MNQIFAFITLATLCTFAQAKTIIHAGKVIPANSSEFLYRASVIVDNDRITDIQSGYQSPSDGDVVIDLKNATLLPGLMDMHVHITQEQSPGSYAERLTLNEADFALNGVVYAERTLMAGFTTVRNLGDTHNETVALRNAINNDKIVGPRIYTAAKSLASTGGHADPTNGRNKYLMGNPGPREGVVNGIADARQAVRQRYKDGADLIKITATGGVLSLAKNGQNPQFMMDELEAIVNTAKDYGMTVAVHAHGQEGMERAIKAGVDSIEHGTYMSPGTMELMKQHGTWYVPTITAGNWVAEKSAIQGFFPEVVRPKAAAIGPLIRETFSRAYKAGVNIAFGTDSGVSAHGDNGKEFILMVEAGMEPLDAIRSATINAAKLLQADDQLGSIEVGKLADLVAVNGDPLREISTMRNVIFVMKNGKVFKQQ